MEFSIYDEVEVIGDNYSITGEGSWGIVVVAGNGYCTVEFLEYRNSEMPNEPLSHWVINNGCLKLRGAGDAPYASVIRKIKEIDSKRKALGYKY